MVQSLFWVRSLLSSFEVTISSLMKKTFSIKVLPSLVFGSACMRPIFKKQGSVLGYNNGKPRIILELLEKYHPNGICDKEIHHICNRKKNLLLKAFVTLL